MATVSQEPHLFPDPVKGRRRQRARSGATKATFLLAMAVSAVCFVSAVVLATGRQVSGDRQLTEIRTGPPEPVIVNGVELSDDALSVNAEDIKIAEPDAATFLVTGADSGDCENQNDPTVGPRSSERSDTIMLWRVNPENDQMAILSMPRDLWVERPGGFRSRINTAYDPADPQELIDTIALNFDVQIDHYLQIDFCAFRTIVDAVGGVKVPFDYPAKDPASLLNVDKTGCVTLDGNMALSYVRSRHYQYEYPVGSGEWHVDPTSDFGRIARQQDFIRRVIGHVTAQGLYAPAVLSSLIQTNARYIVYDTELTLGKMLEFGNSVRSLDPSKISTYRVDSYPDTVRGAQVERPRLSGDNMQAILAIFRGDALLADAPIQEFTETTIAEDADATDTSDAKDEDDQNGDDRTGATVDKSGVDDTSAANAGPPPKTTPDTRPTTSEVVDGVTIVDVASNSSGIVPDPNRSCE